jgi:transcriptional regulator with XRE-family HTH domain
MPLVVAFRPLREAAGLSQSELARRARVTQSTVSALELGKSTRVDLPILDRIAKVLGVSPLALLRDEPVKRKRKGAR